MHLMCHAIYFAMVQVALDIIWTTGMSYPMPCLKTLLRTALSERCWTSRAPKKNFLAWIAEFVFKPQDPQGKNISIKDIRKIEHDNLHNCKSLSRKSMIVGYDENIIHELDLQWFAMNRQSLKLYSTVPGLIPLFRIWFLCHVSIAKLQRHVPSLPISASI